MIMDDLKNYVVKECELVKIIYWGYDVVSVVFFSFGGLIV